MHPILHGWKSSMTDFFTVTVSLTDHTELFNILVTMLGIVATSLDVTTFTKLSFDIASNKDWDWS